VIAGRDSRVVGYYTLAVGSVEHANAPAAVKKGLGQYPIPVIILARLATDKSIHGKGFGLALLKDALKRAYNVSREVGVRAVLVHAKEYVDLSCESSREIAARIGVAPAQSAERPGRSARDTRKHYELGMGENETQRT